MKAIVKHDVLFYNGRRGKINQTFIVPEFEEKITDSIIFKGEKVKTTILEQVDDFISEIDKKDFMEENDIQIIYNWEIISCKVESEKITSTSGLILKNKSTEIVLKSKKKSNSEIVQIFATEILEDKLKDDFISVYSSMKSSIKSLNYKKQIEIVFDGMKVAYKSAHNVYDRLEAIRNGEEVKQLNK